MKFRDRIARFMYGRYGMDQFSRFLVIAALVLVVVSMFFGSVVHTVLWAIGLAALVYSYVRLLSKNYDKRRRENAWYLRQQNAVTKWFRSLKDRWQQRKEFRFFRCPSCHTLLRVPKGKGKVALTCSKCGHRFERKT